MGTVAEDGEFTFIVHPRDHQPPHCHVRFGGQEVRVNLLTGELIDAVPGSKRKPLLEAYDRHEDAIWREWARFHEGG